MRLVAFLRTALSLSLHFLGVHVYILCSFGFGIDGSHVGLLFASLHIFLPFFSLPLVTLLFVMSSNISETCLYYNVLPSIVR